MEYETATEQLQRLQRSAYELWHKDNRYRALVQSAVHIARDEFGPFDPDEADRAVNDIATRACLLIAAQILEGDAELKHLREMNAKLQDMALGGFRLTTMPTLAFGPTTPEP